MRKTRLKGYLPIELAFLMQVTGHDEDSLAAEMGGGRSRTYLKEIKSHLAVDLDASTLIRMADAVKYPPDPLVAALALDNGYFELPIGPSRARLSQIHLGTLLSIMWNTLTTDQRVTLIEQLEAWREAGEG